MRFLFSLLFLAACSAKSPPLEKHLPPESSIESRCASISWKGLGPFLTAPTEGFVDHLFAFGGEQKIIPQDDQVFTSEFAPQAKISWVPVKSLRSKDGLEFKNTPWDHFQKMHGPIGVMNTVYFYGELELPSAEKSLIRVQEVGSFILNGRTYLGQPYRYRSFGVPIEFDKGKNQILLKSTGLGPPQMAFECQKAEDLIIGEDITAPDLVRDETNRILIGIPLLNTSSSWIKNLTWEIYENDRLIHSAPVKFSLAPGAVLKDEIEFEIQPVSEPSVRNIEIRAVTAQSEIKAKRSLALPQIDPSKPRKVAFRSSIDGSVQYFSVIPPRDATARKRYELIVHLHGANVEAYDAVQTVAQKDWAYVVFPTNRRPHGFGWQSVGRLDALEVIDVALKAWPIDPEKIYLTGHSMGGQGVWHLGVNHPDRFAGFAPSAGWISFETYLPEFFQKLRNLGRSDLVAFFGRALDSANHMKFLKNLNGRPVAITHAEKDENVPAVHSRLMLKELERLKNPVLYTEAATDEHWCQEPKNPDQGFFCVDHAAQYEFLRSQPSTRPESFQIQTVDLSEGHEFFWLRLLAQEKIMAPTSVKARVSGQKIFLETENVAALQILRENLPSLAVSEIHWNGRKFPLSFRPLSFRQASPKRFENQLARYGTIKTIFHGPVAIVVGTKGSDAETRALLHLGALISQRVWAVANASAPVFLDSTIPDSMKSNRNLILLGSKDRNRLTGEIFPKLPFAKTSKIEAVMPGAAINSTLLSFWPSPWGRIRNLLIVAGSSAETEVQAIQHLPLIERRIVNQFDFLILSPEMKSTGWAGLLAAGYFSKDFDLTNQDFVVLTENIPGE